jgi:hypothetical protein
LAPVECVLDSQRAQLGSRFEGSIGKAAKNTLLQSRIRVIGVGSKSFVPWLTN